MSLPFFPVPLDDIVSDLKRDGVFHIFFVLDNYRRQNNEKVTKIVEFFFGLPEYPSYQILFVKNGKNYYFRCNECQ